MGVLDISNWHCSIGHTIIHNCIHTDSNRVFGENLEINLNFHSAQLQGWIATDFLRRNIEADCSEVHFSVVFDARQHHKYTYNQGKY